MSQPSPLILVTTLRCVACADTKRPKYSQAQSRIDQSELWRSGKQLRKIGSTLTPLWRRNYVVTMWRSELEGSD